MIQLKRIMAFVLLLAIALSSFSVAFATTIQPRASELIVDRFIYAFAYGNGKIEFTVDMSTYRSVDKIGFPSIELQEKQGGSWETVKSATDKYGYNCSMFSYSIPYNGTSGNEYRVVVEYYAKDGSISDTKTKTSSILIAK